MVLAASATVAVVARYYTTVKRLKRSPNGESLILSQNINMDLARKGSCLV